VEGEIQTTTRSTKDFSTQSLLARATTQSRRNFMSKIGPIVVAQSETLSASLAPVGVPVRVTEMVHATVWFKYKRNLATNGSLVFAVEVHFSKSATAPDVSDNNWSRVPVLDGNSYAAGNLRADTLQITFPSQVTSVPIMWHYPGIDISGVWWLRVLLTETSGGTPHGTVDVWLTGSSA
jgi:hypothetical protein